MTDPIAEPDVVDVNELPTARRRGVDCESLVDPFHASGLTQKAFCEREGVLPRLQQPLPTQSQVRRQASTRSSLLLGVPIGTPRVPVERDDGSIPDIDDDPDRRRGRDRVPRRDRDRGDRPARRRGFLMSARWTPERVFVYRHPVDMRKQIDGLSALVALELGHDPADRSAYVFVSRCRRRVKVLIWHLNGYWLLYKRLEAERFHWPDWFGEEVSIELDAEQFDYLLDGYDLNGMRPHRVQAFARHF